MKYFLLALTIVFLLPATVTAKQGTGAISVMPGTEIIKQSTYKGSSRLELTIRYKGEKTCYGSVLVISIW